MEIEIHHSRTLPAFSISVADLEDLFHRVVTLLFDPKDNLFTKIELTLKSGQLQFKSPGELYAYTGVGGSIRSFSMSVSGEKGRVSLRCHSFPGSMPPVMAAGNTDEWCVTALETVDSFLVPHRRWYHRFTGWPTQLLSFNPWFMYIALLWILMPLPLAKVFVGAWFAIFVFLPVISFAKGVFLPDAVLRLPKDRQLVRQHA